jgi:IS605 OrfB family transposase
MNLCHNNPYVNTILIDNGTRLEQQKTWLKKRRKRMTHQVKVITKKINEIKEKNKHDRRLNGLYARKSSILAKLNNLKLVPIVFGSKKVVNYCINKGKGIVIEDLQFYQEFSYNKKRNRKLSNLKTTALQLLERKCKKRGVSFRKVFPGYTSLIGKYKYSGLHNLSVHHLASYVIARRGLGFKEAVPPIYYWVLSQVGEFIEPRLNQGTPYRTWSMIHDLFKHSGITSFKTAEILQKTVFMKYVLNSVTSAQSDNLRSGLSSHRKIDDYHKTWAVS